MISKRKQFLINPKFQLSFIRYTLLLVVIVLATFYGANLYLFRLFAEKGENLGLPPGHVFFAFIQEQQSTMDIVFAGTALLAALFISIYGLLLSHRIAGPIHHLKLFFRGYKENEKRALSFREKDYFKDLAEEINDALDLKSKS